LIWAAIRTFRSSGGKPSIALTPDLDARMPAQNSSTVVPIGETTPIPVTTTRRAPFGFAITTLPDVPLSENGGSIPFAGRRRLAVFF
jgi:hypothetical protein